MEYVARLLQSRQFRQLVRELEELEKDRQYCRHDFAHFMDVARLAVLVNLEQNLGLEQEMIYLTALLHDLGRVQEYQYGISHEIAGEEIAVQLLNEIGYPSGKMQVIRGAVSCHRGNCMESGRIQGESGQQLQEDFTKLIRQADKKVRPCFFCRAQSDCKWNVEKRNTPENWR